MHLFKSLRVIKLLSPWERLLWTLRLMRWKNTFPRSYRELAWGDPPTEKEYRLALHTWEFLAPFFASRGYTLYDKRDGMGDSLVPAVFPTAAGSHSYPFSRLIPGNDRPEFGWDALSVWGARDKLGRDVVIKAISDVSNPSDELNVMQRLNEKELRMDPYNHTIHTLEFITFDELVFVVMPRWDMAWITDFINVSEVMEIAKAFLEVFVFLHKNRIVHHDFLEQNSGMNVIADYRVLEEHKGLRVPGEVQYTLYDFGAAIAYPKDAVIEDLVATRRLNFELRDLPPVEGPYNPFKADMALMAGALQAKVRHLENIVPELGPFFDSLVDTFDPNQLNAPQALSRFLEIYRSLTKEKLQEPVLTWYWQFGKSLERPQY